MQFQDFGEDLMLMSQREWTEVQQLPRADTREYRAAYNIGWRYSAGQSATLDHVDSRYDRDPRYDAIHDGYLDMAAGRPKWHMLNCFLGQIECGEHSW